MPVYICDKSRAEVVDAETGVVVEDRLIDYGPEWRSYRPGARRCHVMYQREPQSLRFFRGMIPRYIYEDARYIMSKLGLSGRAGALAAIIYSAKRFGTPLPPEIEEMARADRRRVYRVYKRIAEAFGTPQRADEGAVARVAGLAVKLGRPQLAPVAVKLYRELREKHQGFRTSTLAAIALVKAGFPAREVSRVLRVSLSTLSKALKQVEG